VSYQLTGGWLVVKSPQYIEEATYGVTPSSPTFVTAGPLVSMADSQNIPSLKYRQIGSRDIYAMIKTGEEYSFELTFNPIDATLIGYGINLPAGTGTIEKSLSFVKSQKLNNVENYIVYTGSKCDQITIEVTADGAVNTTMSFICKNISTPATTPGFTGTPTYAATPTLIPWQNWTPGAGPLTINSTIVDTDSFSMTVTNNIQMVKINGETTPKFVDPTVRDITFSFDTLFKDIALISDSKSLTARSMEYKLSTDKKLVFTDAYMESVDTSDDVGSTDPKKLSIAGTAKAVTIASY
jgi:hypothetical protein